MHTNHKKEDKPNPLNLLINTFNPDVRDGMDYPSGVRVLGRVYQAIAHGDLEINGQDPDENYPLGEYLIHGNRIRFDLRELNNDEQMKFFNHLVKDAEVEPRTFATHHFSSDKKDASGVPFEIVPHGIEKAVGAFHDIMHIRNKQHFGVNLPIGGVGTQVNGCTVEENGEHGHLYIHRDLDMGMMMVGVEGSASRKHNKRTGAVHSATGAPSDLSAFMALKGNNPALIQEQRDRNICPMTTVERANWACVFKIKQETYVMLLNHPLELDTLEKRQAFITMLTSPHPNSIEVTNIAERERAMINWQQITNGQTLTAPLVSSQDQINLSEEKSVSSEQAQAPCVRKVVASDLN